ncbi:hypothetical protein RSAG8_05763, partial [Rhizoctonia solani AG-8 WAC10335]
MPKDTLNIIRLVTHGTLEQICVFDSRKPTPEVWDALLEAIFDSGLYEIIGRILMLVTREREEPAQWDLFLHGITELHNAIGGHLEIPPAHSESATHEWSKLFYHLNYLGSRALDPSETPRRLLEDVLAAWLRLFGLDSLKSTIKKFKYEAYMWEVWEEKVLWFEVPNNALGLEQGRIAFTGVFVKSRHHNT